MNGIRDLSLLVPFLLSDGGMSAKGKNGWLIYFRNKNKVLINHFTSTLKEYTDNTIQTIRKKDGTSFVRVNDKELGNKLLEYCSSYRTKACSTFPICPRFKNKRGPCKICTKKTGLPPTKIPSMFLGNKKLAILFLRIYFSCDGGVSVTKSKTKYPYLIRKVFVDAKHPRIREDLKKMLFFLGFLPKSYDHQIRLTCKEEITKFQKIIGFIKDVKIGNDSKKFAGQTKNEVLRLIIKSYKNPIQLMTRI